MYTRIRDIQNAWQCDQRFCLFRDVPAKDQPLAMDPVQRNSDPFLVFRDRFLIRTLVVSLVAIPMKNILALRLCKLGRLWYELGLV